jgi:hypothetical protein
MTGIRPPTPIGGHLREHELVWVPFDASALVELARVQAPELPELPDQVARIQRGAWECDAYVRFLPSRQVRGKLLSAVLETGGEELVVDVDQDGQLVGMELLHVAMSESHAD